MELPSVDFSRRLIDDLESGALFSRLFQSNSTYGQVVGGWAFAAKASKLRKWRAVEDVVCNYYRLNALKNSAQWGSSRQPLMDAISLLMEPISAQAWAFFSAAAGSHAPLFHDAFNVHLTWACVELEAPLDIPEPFFSRLLMPVYIAGHIPCGLTGKDCAVDLAYVKSLTCADLVVA
jgi:hypothetical protein